jgi:hypothetical protein
MTLCRHLINLQHCNSVLIRGQTAETFSKKKNNLYVAGLIRHGKTRGGKLFVLDLIGLEMPGKTNCVEFQINFLFPFLLRSNSFDG